MAAPTSAHAVSQLVATTRDKMDTGEVIDQILKTTPALDLFRGKVKSSTGPVGMSVPLFAGDDDTDLLGADGSFAISRTGDVLTKAVYGWGKAVVSRVRLDWEEIEMNKGNETQLVSIADAAVRRALAGHARALDALIHGTHAKQATSGVAGFNTLIGDGELGGVDPAIAGNEFWKSTTFLTSAADMDVRKAFRKTLTLIGDACGDAAQPDVALVGKNVYEAYEDSLDEHVRIAAGASAQAIDTQFTQIKHDGLLLRRDPFMPADEVYFINTADLKAEYLNDLFLKDMGEQQIVGTFETVRPWSSKISLGLGARNRHGRLVFAPTA